LPLIRTPALVVWSKGDFGVSFTTASNVTAAISGSRLLWLDEETGHLISGNRPELIANLACRLVNGETPAQVAANPPRELLRAGEGFE
jgi:hypothetical protein